MKSWVVALLGLVLTNAVYAADGYVDFLPLQLQYRYEDTASQTKDYVRYESYGAAIQSNQFRFALDYAKHRDQSGNLSYNIETNRKDFILAAGYKVYTLDAKATVMQIDFFANAILGVGETEVQTTLLGVTTSTTADQNAILGLGASIVVHYSYLVIEADGKVLNSKDFSPTTVFSSQLKVGLSIPI